MPKTRRFDPAVRAVESWLETLPGPVHRLDAQAVRLYPDRGVAAGWRVSVTFEGFIRRLDILLDDWFPFSTPKIALVDRPEFLIWPHVERDGVLCLLPTAATSNSTEPQALVQHVLACACRLVEECIAGTNLDDFRQEFLSYWDWTVPKPSTRVISLIKPGPPTRAIRLWTGKSYYLLGDDDVDIQKWLGNRRGERTSAKDTTDGAVLLWLPEPLLPSEYPRSGSDLLTLARHVAGEDLLTRMVADHPEQIVVALGSTTANGPCLAAVNLPTPAGFFRTKNRSARSITAGFRKDKMPPNVLASRYFGGNKVKPSNVERVDAGWVHGRDQNPYLDRLRNSHVVLLGCGSVGAPVALGLIQAGLGRLSLVDPDVLSWSNISRHPLRAGFVGTNKADALAERIKSDFPQVVDVSSFPRRWQELLRVSPQLLKSADLIVSAMGDWEAEGALNDWHLEGGCERPIVYGWTEPHACAGHAVAICRTGGCLGCGLDNHGAHRSPSTVWPTSTLLQEPACGAVYQPYGPIELGHIVAMVADVALNALLGKVDESTEWVWTASDELLQKVGGAWGPSGRDIVDAKGATPFVSRRAWTARADCDSCRK